MFKNTCLLFLSIIFFSSNFAFALTPLPKTAQLRLGDNDINVSILQQILNSNPETIVVQTGPGSTGKEIWYFGLNTENAVKKFQALNNLPTTGELDSKTITALNNYVANYGKNTVAVPAKSKNTGAAPSKSTTTSSPKNENVYLDNNVNPYLYADAITSIDPKNTNKTPASSSTNQNSILPSNLPENFIPNSGFSNTYSPNTPYFNPATGLYQSTPQGNANSMQPASNPLSSLASLFGSQSGSGSSGNIFGNLLGNSPIGRAITSGGIPLSQQSGLPDGTRLVGGNGQGSGFGEVVTTAYGHERNGRYDAADNGLPACSSSCSTRKGGKCEKVVSLKRSVRVKIFGNVSKKVWCGKEIEVIYPSRKTCGVYQLYEEGPAEYLTASMDLTGTIWNELDPGGSMSNQKAVMRFRVLGPNDKACEGYTRVDGKTN